MNSSSKGEKVPSGILKHSDLMFPHPPDEPPINTSKRTIQSIQFENKENEIENSKLNPQIESIQDDENGENNEDDENNNINITDLNTINEMDSDNSWLDKLPPVIHPDEELHQQLLKQRHDEHFKRVTSICHCELEAILNYSFECINRRIEDKKKEKQNKINKRRYSFKKNEEREEQERYEKARQARILRAKFRNGLLTPEIVVIQRDPELLFTSVEPFHTLSIQHYLHYQSNSYFPDLSCAFNTSISDTHIEDPNLFFNDFIQKMFNASERFTKPFGTIGSIKFPFIVCVGGPSGGGRTTITQFLQKVFDAHIIQLKQIAQSQKKQKKGSLPPKEPTNDENIELEAPTEYILNNSIQIKYSDDKTAVQQIAQEIKSNMDGRGFIIDGFPNNKNQFAALEKELSSSSLNMKSVQDSLKDRITSQRQSNSKAQIPSIDGLIIALNNEEGCERLVDPQTGNIYKPGFIMPGLPDLVGVSPIEFSKVKAEIDDRLVTITVPEIRIIPPKQIQTFIQFEGVARKTANCIIVKHCKNLKTFIKYIDKFVLSLFSKFPNLLPHKCDNNNIITEIIPPFKTLMHPSYLLLPHQCYDAIITWYNCLNSFGMKIAIQNNLAHTLDGKVDIIIKEATKRYQLLIGPKDERLDICNEFIKTNKNDSKCNYCMNQLFRKIWDISLKIRNKNLKKVDEVVGKSGLIELLLELRESPKIFFIALVKRMLYIKWFYETFQHLIYGESNQNQEEKENATEEENVNEDPPGNEPEKPQVVEEEKSEGNTKGKLKKRQSRGSQSSRASRKNQSSRLSRKSQASRISQSPKGKKGVSQNVEEIMDEEEENIEPLISQLLNKKPEIPDFILNAYPQTDQLQQQGDINKLGEEEEDHQEKHPENPSKPEEVNPPAGVPSINIARLDRFGRPIQPHSARPIHPPDSIRNNSLSNSNNINSRIGIGNKEPKTQRGDDKKVSFVIDQIKDESQSEAENRLKKRKLMTKLHGLDYLLNQLHEFCDFSSNSTDLQSTFDINVICAMLNIEPCEIKSSFEDINKYGEEFFSHVAKHVSEENALLSNEVKTSLAIFRHFIKLCNSKEESMVNSVFDLRDSLTHYAYAKCTNEMENFAQRFRKLKQILNTNQKNENSEEILRMRTTKNTLNLAKSSKKVNIPIAKNTLVSPRSPDNFNASKKASSRLPRRTIVNSARSPDRISPRTKTMRNVTNATSNNNNSTNNDNINTDLEISPSFSECYSQLGAPLFEFDTKHVIDEIQELAVLELTFETPIIAQDLISSETLIKIAQYASQLHLFHASGMDMLQAFHDVLFGSYNGEEEEEEEAIEEEELIKEQNRVLEFRKFQFCMVVFECVERFDVLHFLLCFAHSRDEELLIMRMFHDSRSQ